MRADNTATAVDTHGEQAFRRTGNHSQPVRADMNTVLSITVAAKGDCDPEPFIAALVHDGADIANNVDIHIAHDAPWHTVSAAWPDNVFLHECPIGTSIMKLWGTAISHSSGDYVAVLDINTPPAAGWLDAATAAIRNASALFFGPVNCGWAPDEPGIVGYLAEYAQFRSPLAQNLQEVPGNNLVCRRDLLDNAAKLASAGFFKTFMIWRLASEESRLPARSDDMIVTYRKPFRYRDYMKRRFEHGRCFGVTRHDNDGQPSRLACIGFAFFLPVLRTWRIYRTTRTDRDLKNAFYRHLHLILQAELAWSFGELLGYLFRNREYCENLT